VRGAVFLWYNYQYMSDDDIKKKILVVDNEEVVRKAVAEELEEDGFEVILAKDGKEGLKFALDKKPDVILLDLGLPKMDGLTVLSKLREDGWGKEAKVIIFSVNDPDRETLDAVNKLKPAYYLVKSNWSLDEVVKRLKEVTKTM